MKHRINRQISTIFFLLFGMGFLVLTGQDQLLTRLDWQNGSPLNNLIAVQADPPGNRCFGYGKPCIFDGYVFCQDPGKHRQPIEGATVLVYNEVLKKTHKIAKTDAKGFFKFLNTGTADREDGGPEYRSYRIKVQSLPPGQNYANMKPRSDQTCRQFGTRSIKCPDAYFAGACRAGKPPDAPLGCKDMKPEHIQGSYWEIPYTNCSTIAPTCQSQVQISAVKESPNILTFTAIYRLPKRENNVQMTFHLDKDGTNVSDSPSLAANYLGQTFDEKGNVIHRYSTSWSYTLSDTSNGSSAQYHVSVDTVPPADTNVQGAQDPPTGNIPEVFFISPESLKLGTFSFENIGTGCKELTFRVTWITEDIITPSPSP